MRDVHLGVSGFALVLTRSGLLVAHSRRDLNQGVHDPLAELSPELRALAGDEAVVAARRSRNHSPPAGEVVSLRSTRRRVEQEPTVRERQVLQLIADGLANREIGEELHLSEETVKSHVRHLLAQGPMPGNAHSSSSRSTKLCGGHGPVSSKNNPRERSRSFSSATSAASVWSPDGTR